jgi:hypothetical protein
MNRIPAMCLSGWVLMFPPVAHNDSTGKFDMDLHAPYSRWEQLLVFDNAQECNNSKIQVSNAGTEYLRKQQAEWDRILEELRAKYPDDEQKRVDAIVAKGMNNWTNEEFQVVIDYFKRDRPPVDERRRQEFQKRVQQNYSREKHATALARLDARCVPSDVIFPASKR